MINEQSYHFFQSLLVTARTDIDKYRQWILGSLSGRLFDATDDLGNGNLYNGET